jgi:hypothetical protein
VIVYLLYTLSLLLYISIRQQPLSIMSESVTCPDTNTTPISTTPATGLNPDDGQPTTPVDKKTTVLLSTNPNKRKRDKNGVTHSVASHETPAAKRPCVALTKDSSTAEVIEHMNQQLMKAAEHLPDDVIKDLVGPIKHLASEYMQSLSTNVQLNEKLQHEHKRAEANHLLVKQSRHEDFCGMRDSLLQLARNVSAVTGNTDLHDDVKRLQSQDGLTSDNFARFSMPVIMKAAMLINQPQVPSLLAATTVAEPPANPTSNPSTTACAAKIDDTVVINNRASQDVITQPIVQAQPPVVNSDPSVASAVIDQFFNEVPPSSRLQSVQVKASRAPPINQPQLTNATQVPSVTTRPENALFAALTSTSSNPTQTPSFLGTDLDMQARRYDALFR